MREFKALNSLEDIDELLTHRLSFLYISRVGCSVCHSLLPQVQSLMEDYPEIALGHIEVNELPEVVGRFNIFTVPVLILFVEGKEYLREARIVQMDEFNQKLSKIYQGVLGE